ncbi:MAG: ABC transporter ATP-binding protein [Caldilineaceae bacterium]|nr:ABC transporter ATP-binding protein [Caldilineaceae bacterium]
MSVLELQNLSKSYGSNHVLRDVSLTVDAGEFMVVYGLPVSGKSVLVRLLTGLEQPDAGRILLRGVDITNFAPGARNLGYVPQSFALYPHFSVRDNIAYPLDLAHVPKTERNQEVERVAQLLDIADLLDRRPDQLSGGQKQRVAIARGLVKRTDVYVLDDPLVGLDFKLRERLIDDLKRTQEMLNVTFVYMTSDAVESMMLATKIAVLAAGEIVECAPPVQLYQQPQRAESMRYVGFPQANLLPATLAQDGAANLARTPFFQFAWQPDDDGAALDGNATVTVGLRPEHMQIGRDAPAGHVAQEARVLLREDLGGEEIVYLDLDGQPLTTVLRSDDQSQLHVDIDQRVPISIDPTTLVVFADNRRVGSGLAAA